MWGDESDRPLPRIVLLADRFTDPAVSDRVCEAVRAGIAWVHLRDHSAEARPFGVAAAELVKRLKCLDPRILISVNTRIECVGAGVDGVHLGHRGPSVDEARHILGPNSLIGYSAHSIEEARKAERQGADYIFFSPVFPTSSKPGSAGVGLDGLAVCCAAVVLPVFALGGITPTRVPDCLYAGAYGVAVISGILGAGDVAQAVRGYRLAISD
jgi:thiamine-phosphate pyrophosphorylase